ncbi:MAG: prepilin-type N-terminal cleavage/methylation domain-containing protein [Verrucomicrobiaceae bacterium]|nr:prepilin-type N-terminal cleavage/methylation domain-containing protein [Verrucomicrobiaceae bacterium]
MRKGFTLVEVSIVLVIIGLLIGGILVAKSMVRTAKINAQIQQLQQFDIAVTQFREKFQQLPGDSSLFSPAGNNNRIIDGGDWWGGVAIFPWLVATEAGNFWKHMSDSRVIPTTFSAVDPSVGVVPDLSIPKAKIGIRGTVVVGTSIRSNGYAQDHIGDWWVLCYRSIPHGNSRFCGGISGQYSYDTSLLASDASALDLKLDDGNPDLGIVLAGSIPGGDAHTSCASGGVYLTSQSRPYCGLHIKMFGISHASP